jgi:hypothetical protein
VALWLKIAPIFAVTTTADFWWRAAAIFAIMAVLDFVWAKYTYATTSHRSLAAGFYAVLIIVLSGLNVLGYTHDPLLLIPAGAGAFVGTSLTVRLSKA